jgi:hypothetical protein
MDSSHSRTVVFHCLHDVAARRGSRLFEKGDIELNIKTSGPPPTADLSNSHQGSDQRTYAFAILNKTSEPRAILVAWLDLSPQHRGNAHVISVMRSLSKGRDPYVESLHGFLSLCKQAGVGVVVSYDNGAHQFVIDPCGSGYTPASRDCPIRREPNETDKDFWTRWNLHRAGCFSMLVHDILESESLNLDQLIETLLYDESCGQLIKMRDWLISRERAEFLANGIFSTPATDKMSVEPPQVRAGSPLQAAVDDPQSGPNL